MAFTVEPDGSVSHINVVSEKPKGCGFADDVVFSFRKWKFPPKIENGVAVQYSDVYYISVEAGY